HRGLPGDQGRIEVLDVKLAAEARQELDVAADRGSKIEDLQPRPPGESLEQRGQSERAVALGSGGRRRGRAPILVRAVARSGAAGRKTAPPAGPLPRPRPPTPSAGPGGSPGGP